MRKWYAHKGVLWDESGEIVSASEADAVASRNGLQYAENLVKKYEGKVFSLSYSDGIAEVFSQGPEVGRFKRRLANRITSDQFDVIINEWIKKLAPTKTRTVDDLMSFAIEIVAHRGVYRYYSRERCASAGRPEVTLDVARLLHSNLKEYDDGFHPLSPKGSLTEELARMV